jgi:dTDP-4-amino-4,6-dideoxygalactose transaminase
LSPIDIEQVEVEVNPDFQQHGNGHVTGLTGDGRLQVQGWAIGNGSLPLSVELRDQSGKVVGAAPIDVPRTDIAEAFAGIPGASTAGFAVPLRPLGSGSSRIQVDVAFEDGEMVRLGTLTCEIRGNGEEALGWLLAVDEIENEKVLTGKEGWLYLRGDTNNILAQQTGKLKLDAEKREGWRDLLEARVAASERLGVRWACLVVPDKESVYPEYLPDTVVPSDRRPVHEFLDVANEVGAPVSYALDPLLAAKREGEVYAHTDTHWNFRGAYVAYRALCSEALRQGVDLEVLEETDLGWVTAEIEGDLGSKVRPQPKTGPTIRVELKQARGGLVFDNEVTNHGRVMVFERDGEGPTCVLFGESFAHYLLVFLKETFKRLVFVHTSSFIGGVIERERPDVVFSLPLERFLIRLPSDVNAYEELRATALRKGGKLPWPVEEGEGEVPFSRPFVSGRELEYLEQAIATRDLAGGGEFTRRCQDWLREATGSPLALLSHSATGALEAAMMLAELGPGDEAVMPSFGYPTMATAVVRQGATPVFVDIDPATLNVDPARVEAAVGERTKAIVAVHYGGVGCEMDRLKAIAAASGLRLIEDAAHCLLAEQQGKALGSIGDLGAISFHETKNVTCGEGGVLLVNDPALAERAQVIWDKGTNRARFLRGEVDRYSWVDVGSSFGASDLTAAFLFAQLEAAEKVTARRRAIWDRYHAGFEKLEREGLAQRPTTPPGGFHNGHVYYLVLSDASARQAFIERLREQRIATVFHFVPLHDSPGGQRFGRVAGSLDHTEEMAGRLVRLPLYPDLDEESVGRVIAATRSAVTELAKG